MNSEFYVTREHELGGGCSVGAASPVLMELIQLDAPLNWELRCTGKA